MLLELSTVEPGVENIPELMRPSDTPVVVGDAGKLRALGDWQPVIPLEQSLEDALDYWRGRQSLRARRNRQEGKNDKNALITGITGQDGSYLAEFLLEKGYDVFGMVRRSSTENFERIEQIRDKVTLIQADLLDQMSLIAVISESQPDEIYNLAAQSFVPTSWTKPVLTAEFTALGVTRMLEAMRLTKSDARFYQASSSEMFGKVAEVPQTENTPFHPRSPYGVAKVYGHFITVNYRESYDLYACSGILFNHESPRRGYEFVTRKVTDARRPHQAGPGRRDAHGQPGRQARLGLCRGLRADDVDDAAAGRAGRLCHLLRRDPFGRGAGADRLRARRPGLERIRQDRPAFRAAGRSRPADRRCHQGQGKAGLGAARSLSQR